VTNLSSSKATPRMIATSWAAFWTRSIELSYRECYLQRYALALVAPA
jgi:hypothetical protein